jgi:hypothetical protein
MILATVAPPAFAPPPAVPPGVGLAPPRPWALSEHPAFNNRACMDDVVMVACFFNPAGHARPVHNLGAFLDWCHGARVPLFMAELSFHDQAPLLPRNHSHVVHFRLGENGIMFQKEALLSAMVRRLPKGVRKVFLVDADVVPADPQQLGLASILLDDVPMVQPFSDAVWCDRTGSAERSKRSTAWACSHYDARVSPLDSVVFHPGFCVGLRRDFFDRVGDLYGCPITGTGDLALWQAAMSAHVPLMSDGVPICTAPAPQAYREKVADWCGGQVGFVPGQMRHFWHGSTVARAYRSRHKLLEGFRPDVHLSQDARSGLPIWTEAGRPYQEAMRAYFASRAEDV